MSRNRKKKQGNRNQRISATKNAVLCSSSLDDDQIPLGGHLTNQSSVERRNPSIPFARIHSRE